MYDQDYPIAVFGTLRCLPECQGNASLMFNNAQPLHHHKAFLPHLVPCGLDLNFKLEASGAFEVFEYNNKDYEKVIPMLDRLEGFNPNNPQDSYYYVRTLMELKLLPDDYQSDTYDIGIFHPGTTFEDQVNLGDLGIPRSQWDHYKSILAWVYSNAEANMLASTFPVVWAPH